MIKIIICVFNRVHILHILLPGDGIELGVEFAARDEERIMILTTLSPSLL